jgi:hypothetical protein
MSVWVQSETVHLPELHILSLVFLALEHTPTGDTLGVLLVDGVRQPEEQ